MGVLGIACFPPLLSPFSLPICVPWLFSLSFSSSACCYLSSSALGLLSLFKYSVFIILLKIGSVGAIPPGDAQDLGLSPFMHADITAFYLLLLQPGGGFGDEGPALL